MLLQMAVFCSFLLMSNTPCIHVGFCGGSVVKNPPANVGHVGLIPWSGRSRREGHGNPHQYYCMENPMDSGA